VRCTNSTSLQGGRFHSRLKSRCTERMTPKTERLDRGVVTVADREDLKAKEADIVKLVNLWMEATAD
jgi:hypothetical protein